MANQEQDLIEKANNLLADIKKVHDDFARQTTKFVSNTDKIAEELEEMDLDKELGKIERESVEEMDVAVLDFLSEEGEE